MNRRDRTSRRIARARDGSRENDPKMSQRRANLVDDAQARRQDAVRGAKRRPRDVFTDVL